jgi:methylated-DNA-[protein]-cysteine S-methyltransferase
MSRRASVPQRHAKVADLGQSALTAEHAGQRRAATAYCYWDLVASPFRSLCVAVDAGGRLVEIRLDGQRPEGRRDAKRCKDSAAQLGEYFAGSRRTFDLELAPYGTDFQLRVWAALRAIPYGAVRNYGDIARAIGQPGAARAVGQANGCNPLPIVIPCHRVIASDGTIGGYSGGLAIKHRLLALEGAELDL